MAKTLLIFVALAALVSQGFGVTEIRHPDEAYTHVSNPLFARAISIPQFPWDTVVACQVIFPNGVPYNVFPTNNLPASSPTISAAGSSAFGPSCGIVFRNSPPSVSGTYELIAHIRHRPEDTPRETMNRKRYTMTFTMTEVEFPFKS